jgi:hypothetical protein
MQQAVRVLDEIQSRRIRIEFDRSRCCGSWGRELEFQPLPIIENTLSMLRLDLLPDITLATHPDPYTLRLITTLVHESVHAGQRQSLIPNIKNEVEAFSVQWVLRDEMGLGIADWQRAFVTNFTDGYEVTDSFDALCDARKLITTCYNSSYNDYMIDLSTSAALCGYAYTPVYDSLVRSGVVNPSTDTCS